MNVTINAYETLLLIRTETTSVLFISSNIRMRQNINLVKSNDDEKINMIVVTLINPS